MSDNTMSTAASSPALSAQQTPAAGPQNDFVSDTDLMLSAIARMETAVRSERAAHERLRTDLAALADAIAHVKASLQNAESNGKPINVHVLLIWLEARVSGMRAYLGAGPAAVEPTPQAAAEPAAAEVVEPESAVAPASDHETAGHEAVPTVSEVVSRLGRASDALEKEAHALEQSAAPAADDVPTVSMLGAMVEALTAPEPAETEAKAEPETPAQMEYPVTAQVAEPEAAALDVTPEATMAEAIATDADVAEIVADDPAPEVTAFAEELGSAEPPASEPEATATLEAEPTQPEVLAVEAIVTDEPTAQMPVAEEPVLGATVSEAPAPEHMGVEADPVADMAATVSEPAEAETAVAAEASLPEPEAIASETSAEATADIAPVETTATEAVAVAEEPAAVTHEPSAHEFELLTRFAAMEAIPFMRDEVGTAVIFEPKPDFDPAAEQMAFEIPAKSAEAAVEPVEIATQPEAMADEPQHETVAAVEPEAETVESAIAATEAVAPIEAHAEAPLETESEMAVAAQQPLAVPPPPRFAAYAATSSLSVSLGAIGATAALADTTAPETATVGVLETTAPVEAVEAENDVDETSKIEHFDIDEPETKAEADAAATGVVIDSALDAIVAESAPVTASELVAVAESADASAPEASGVTIETVSIVMIETAESEAAEPEATIGIAEAVETETASAATTEVTIAGPSEAERAAFAQALAEMAVALALEQKAASVEAAEPLAEMAPPASITDEIVAASATPAADAVDTADDDLSDLFEPEPDAALDPNNVLLGPSPAAAPAPAFTLDPATAAVLPMHDMALPEPDKAASAETKSATVIKMEALQAPAPARPHDPLAPLKAMSNEEKIALFS